MDQTECQIPSASLTLLLMTQIPAWVVPMSLSQEKSKILSSTLQDKSQWGAVIPWENQGF
jgi:hypothetical protein